MIYWSVYFLIFHLFFRIVLHKLLVMGDTLLPVWKQVWRADTISHFVSLYCASSNDHGCGVHPLYLHKIWKHQKMKKTIFDGIIVAQGGEVRSALQWIFHHLHCTSVFDTSYFIMELAQELYFQSEKLDVY